MTYQLDETKRLALDEAEASLQQALRDIEQQLRQAGLTDDNLDSERGCRLCDCDHYSPGFLANCRTPGCRHSGLAHRLPR